MLLQMYMKGYGSLDFKTSQGVGDNLLISLSVKNILNSKRKFVYILDNGVVDRDFIYSSNRIISSISLSYKL